MSHALYCLDEIVAEFSARLETNASAKALAEIEERDARGEASPGDAARRKTLAADVLAHPYVQALEKVGELRALIATAEAAEAGRASNVIAFPARREAPLAAEAKATGPRKLVRAVGGIAVAAACLLAVLTWVPGIAAPGAILSSLKAKPAAAVCFAQF